MAQRFGRYETLQPIASGGMATVYLGRAIGAAGFERRVAIKVMHPHVAQDPEFITMFLDEARLAARIHHPNVVGTLDFQRSAEATFLVMEFIDGASLRDIMRALRRRRRRMPIGTAVRIMVDALSGLHAAHELRGDDGMPLELVHRDVSPHNILVGADGITRITDFGVARAAARITSTKGATLKGKIPYMAPEQGLGRGVDRRADVYAAGVVLWETLTGRRLFKADHEGALIAQILHGAERRPRELVAVVPEALDEACMKALSLDPARRFPDAAAFADALETAAHQSDLRIPSTRQLAAFVHEFKLKLSAVPPLEIEEEGSAPPLSEPSFGTSSASELSTPELSTSELSGIGTVRSQRAPEPPPKRSAVGTMLRVVLAALLIGLGGVAALVSAGRLSLPFEQWRAPPTPARASDAPPLEAPIPAAAASEEPSVDSAPPASATASASASASAPLPVAPAVRVPPWRRPPAAASSAPRKSSPLGFEPDDL